MSIFQGLDELNGFYTKEVYNYFQLVVADWSHPSPDSIAAAILRGADVSLHGDACDLGNLIKTLSFRKKKTKEGMPEEW